MVSPLHICNTDNLGRKDAAMIVILPQSLGPTNVAGYSYANYNRDTNLFLDLLHGSFLA